MSRPRPRTSYLLKRLETLVRTYLDTACARHGLSTMQYVALSVLADNGGMSSAELAARSFVSAQSANQMVALLERRALIERTPDPANRRVLRTRLTTKGAAVLERCHREVDLLEEQMFAGVGPEAERHLREVLSTCVTNLARSTDPRAAVLPPG